MLTRTRVIGMTMTTTLARGGDPNVSMDDFKVLFDKDFEISEEEKKRHILFWETNQVLEAGGQSDHPLNRKVTLTVRLKALQGETGLSDEARASPLLPPRRATRHSVFFFFFCSLLFARGGCFTLHTDPDVGGGGERERRR